MAKIGEEYGIPDSQIAPNYYSIDTSPLTPSVILVYFFLDLLVLVIGLLVIYSLRNVSPLSGSHGIPELLAVLAVVLLHLWKRQMLLSIAGGTICYMLLVQFVF